ncbi:NB-ARC, P-loop containing nucleoside triphosphate hydrolase [Artemisia annua]|uniref:NB-ARC, P-loop containing nucleoside triphosphate hydrolase n=1 Tax=Artemisia annua TaxID=35608 RepID=A0A2U1MUG5_ARTAN|nr:NB-ARC, P-loop containing nucleoside triphosphate hydrolase [Artemisia annua]
MSLPVFGFVPKKVQDFVEGLHKVHKVVRDNLGRANSKYKQDATQKRRHVDYEVGGFVWAILTKDRFPVGEYNKLSAKRLGNDAGLSVEEGAILFMEVEDRVRKRASLKVT